MRTTVQRRLDFLSETQDVAKLTAETRLTERRLSIIDEGLAKPTRQQDLNIRSAYQREARSRMREAGFSSAQTDRFAWYTPESVSARIESVSDKVEYLALGRYSQITKKLEQQGVDYDPEEEYYNALDLVREGFATSHKSYEEWMDY